MFKGFHLIHGPSIILGSAPAKVGPVKINTKLNPIATILLRVKQVIPMVKAVIKATIPEAPNPVKSVAFQREWWFTTKSHVKVLGARVA
jgi:hypothetical protein